MRKIKVEISYKNIKKKNIYIPFIKKTLDETIKFLIRTKKIDPFSMSNKNILDVLICDDREIKKINKKYRDFNRATNELSFSYLNDDSSYIGSIVINWDEVLRDSDKNFIDRKRSILNFLAHATLHIFGYTHDMPKNEQKMEKIKYEIISHIEKSFKEIG